MLILRCLASAATRTPPNAAHSKQKGAWKSSFVGGLCPRTHKLGTRHRGHGSCRPLPHGSEGSLPPHCLQAPPLSPQPEPTGSELPTPRPACPHSRDSAGPDVQPCVGSSHHPLLPQQEATLWSPAVPWPAFRSTDLPAPPLLPDPTITPNKRTYTRPLEEILPGVRKPGIRGAGQGAPKLGP